MRHFYAFAARYGCRVQVRSGRAPIGRVRAFTSKRERDAWVEDGADFRHDKGATISVRLSWLRKHCAEAAINAARLECAGQASLDQNISDKNCE